MGTTDRKNRARGRGPSPLTINLVLVVLCLIWGSTWLVIRKGLEDLPPFTSAGIRFAVAAVVMFLITPLLARREGGSPPPTWLWISMGVLNIFVPYALVYWSETILPSGLVSLLWAVFPMLMAILGHLALPGERLVSGQWLGFLLGFAGVVLLFWTDILGLSPGAPLAALVLLLSPLVSAVGNTLVKRYGGATSSILLNRNGIALGALLFMVLAASTELSAEIQWTSAAIISVGYLAIFGTVITFGLYFWVLRYAHAHRVSLIAYVIPAIALAIGWGFGNEPVTLETLAGAGLIIGGVVLVMRPSSHRE